MTDEMFGVLFEGNVHTQKRKLATTLVYIEAFDAEFAAREPLVYSALAIAKLLGYPAGVRFDTTGENAEKWPVVCIDLPDVGEVSWHCPAYPHPFVEYDTKKKYERVRAFAASFKPDDIVQVRR